MKNRLFAGMFFFLFSLSSSAVPLDWKMVLSDRPEEGQKERSSYIFQRENSDEVISFRVVKSEDVSDPKGRLEAMAAETGCVLEKTVNTDLESAGIFQRVCRAETKEFGYLLIVKTGKKYSLLITGYHTDFNSVNDLMKKLTYEPEIEL